jgi:DNA-directed RNA polymerase subunit RPC12/RpoP
MRLIDADRMKENTPNWILESDGIKDRSLHGELDFQPTVISGTVADGKYVYEKITKVKPLIIYYSLSPRYVKYKCPVCSALNNNHQLSKGDSNCPLCNVNLTWEGVE